VLKCGLNAPASATDTMRVQRSSVPENFTPVSSMSGSPLDRMTSFRERGQALDLRYQRTDLVHGVVDRHQVTTRPAGCAV